MPELDTSDETEQSTGSPPWMLTYGDSVTLLLTFFVMLLTFSTPNEEDFQALAQGMMMGSRKMSLFPGQPGHEGLAPQERRLDESRLDAEGAEKPSMQQEEPIEDLRKHVEQIEISELVHLKGAVVIRIPVVALFGPDDRLDVDGERILGRIVQMTRAQAYSMIVRARAGKGTPEEQKQSRSTLLAVRTVGYLRKNAGDLCRDIGVSDDIQLLETPLPEGTCEIVMLEV